MLDALFCLTDPGDEVVLTDPTYAGMLNRVRLVGAVPRLVPLQSSTASGASTSTRLRAAVTDAHARASSSTTPSFPTGWVANDEEWEAIADAVPRP